MFWSVVLTHQWPPHVDQTIGWQWSSHHKGGRHTIGSLLDVQLTWPGIKMVRPVSFRRFDRWPRRVLCQMCIIAGSDECLGRKEHDGFTTTEGNECNNSEWQRRTIHMELASVLLFNSLFSNVNGFHSLPSKISNDTSKAWLRGEIGIWWANLYAKFKLLHHLLSCL